jgi:hypothetical protein
MEPMIRLNYDLHYAENSILGPPRNSPSPVAEEETDRFGHAEQWGHALLLTAMDGGKTSYQDWMDRLHVNAPGADEELNRVEDESEWEMLEFRDGDSEEDYEEIKPGRTFQLSWRINPRLRPSGR